jgi:hypothetical protein
VRGFFFTNSFTSESYQGLAPAPSPYSRKEEVTPPPRFAGRGGEGSFLPRTFSLTSADFSPRVWKALPFQPRCKKMASAVPGNSRSGVASVLKLPRCSAGILPALLKYKGVAGWKPALRQPSRAFSSA